MILEKIDYKKVFYYFEQVSNIPRGSKNNKGISDYLVGFAKDHNLEWHQDKALNVIIMKEATKGYENVPAIIIQGHMDMVCEKDYGVEHDFMTEGLKLRVKDDYIYAEGTTLGGDDGIALAYGLALMSDEELVHPRLEFVFTTDEEIGMYGAAALDTSCLKGKYMLNIDSDEEGNILIGCAGGMTSIMKLPLERKQAEGILLHVSITGLLGGHSGTEITKNRMNGNLMMGRLLFELSHKLSFQIVSMNGGLKDNAIPRESYADILIKSEDSKMIRDEIISLSEKYQNELLSSEPNFLITAEYENHIQTNEVLSEDSAGKVISILLYTPNGIQKMSNDVTGLPESSLNLGIFNMTEEEASFSYSVRSSVSTYKEFLSSKLAEFIKMFGGTYKCNGEYPAWELNKNSTLTQICKDVFKEQYQKEPIIEVIHAGLECGILSSKMKDLDIVSIGPDMMDIHTPKEKLSVSSAIRVYDYVVSVIFQICKNS